VNVRNTAKVVLLLESLKALDLKNFPKSVEKTKKAEIDLAKTQLQQVLNNLNIARAKAIIKESNIVIGKLLVQVVDTDE
jgi:hypothetical protein